MVREFRSGQTALAIMDTSSMTSRKAMVESSMQTATITSAIGRMVNQTVRVHTSMQMGLTTPVTGAMIAMKEMDRNVGLMVPYTTASI